MLLYIEKSKEYTHTHTYKKDLLELKMSFVRLKDNYIKQNCILIH